MSQAERDMTAEAMAIERNPFPYVWGGQEQRLAIEGALRGLGFKDPDRVAPMFKVMLDALRIIDDREAGERKGVWKRSGLRGQCMHLFAKGERAFTQAMRGEIPSRDNFLDAINYAAFAELLRQNDDVPHGFDGEPAGDDILNGDWPWDG